MRPEIGLRIDHRTGEVKEVMQPGRKLNKQTVVEGLSRDCPTWLKKLARRHEQVTAVGTQVQEELPEPETVRRIAPKIGRNDPCPCGSGRKYKKCCGRRPV